MISIIVPVYKVEKWIEKCVISLFSQTYMDIEYLFIDDCSPDRSIDIIHEILIKFPERAQKVKIIRHDNNKGLASARNTGIENACGEYIMHVDSDDWISETTCEECINVIETTGADTVLFDIEHVRRNGNNKIERQKEFPTKIEYIKSLLMRRNVLCMCSGMYKRSLYINNSIEVPIGLNFGEDYSTKPRILYHSQIIKFLHKPLYHYNHLNEISYTTGFRSNDVTSLKRAWDVLFSFFQLKNDFSKTLLQASISIKADLLHLWGVNCGSIEDYNYIKTLFPDSSTEGLSFKQKIYIHLSRFNLPRMISLVSSTGFRIKKLLK